MTHSRYYVHTLCCKLHHVRLKLYIWLDVIFIIGSHSYYHQHHIKHYRHAYAYSYHIPGSKCRLDEMFEKFKLIISFMQIREVISDQFFSNIPRMSSNSIFSELQAQILQQLHFVWLWLVTSQKKLVSDWSTEASPRLCLAVVWWGLTFVPLWYNYHFFTQNICSSNILDPMFSWHIPKKALWQSNFLHHFHFFLSKSQNIFFWRLKFRTMGYLCISRKQQVSSLRREWVNRGGRGPGDGQQKSRHNRRNSVWVSVSQILWCWGPALQILIDSSRGISIGEMLIDSNHGVHGKC